MASWSDEQRKEAVKPRGTVGGRSETPARTADAFREGSGNGLLENMLAALRRVEKNGGAPGTDGVTVESLRDYIKVHWVRIR